MDLSEPHTLELFLSVYGTLPRAGPGGTEYTLRALSMVPGDAPSQILDLGCGPGAQTLDLAEAVPDARILALDILPAMVEEADRRAHKAGLDGQIRVEGGDMAAPPVLAHTIDLIWCEAAIYSLGVETALETWRPLLTQGGTIVFTDVLWLQPERPKGLAEWWHSEYPAITDECGVRDSIGRARFDTKEFFLLPAEAWWTDYYEPMQSRAAQLRQQYPSDPVAIQIAASAEHEIEMYSRHSAYYGYGFFIVQPNGTGS